MACGSTEYACAFSARHLRVCCARLSQNCWYQRLDKNNILIPLLVHSVDTSNQSGLFLKTQYEPLRGLIIYHSVQCVYTMCGISVAFATQVHRYEDCLESIAI